MDVQIRIDGRNNERLEILKAIQYPNQEQRMVETMVPTLYEAAKKGDVDNFVDTLQRVSEEKRLTLFTIFNQVSPSGNSLLHVSASHGSKEITELIARHFPFLITKQNLYGDTPLHIAVNTTETLVKEFGRMSNDVGTLLRIKNKKGNTALHEAVTTVMICNHHHPNEAVEICNHQAEVHFLVMADPEVAYYQNNKGKSPLYLAVKTNNVNIFNIFFQAIEADGDSVDKLQGKSPMYAAIKQKDLVMLKEIVIKKRELMHYKDEKGRTPLHRAASTGFLEGVRLLLNELSDGALESDKKGLYPIHLACKNGHVNVTKELLQHWPDPVELLSNKGQNVLHFAAKSGQVDLVKLLLKTPELDKLVYEKDLDENTPLHLATIRSQYLVVWSLGRRKQDCLKFRNKEGLRAYDIALKQSTGVSKGSKQYTPGKDKQIVNDECLTASVVAVEKKSTMKDSKNSKEANYFDTMMTLSVLNALHLKTHGIRPTVQNLITIEIRRPSKEEINNRINTLMVVAALVAGAAFAAVINMPGGGNYGGGGGGSDHNQDTPKWVNDILIPLFALTNVVALKFSLLTSVFVLWAQLGDITSAAIAVYIGSGVLAFTLYMMSLSFYIAVIIGVIKHSIFVFVILTLEFLLGIVFTIFALPILIPGEYKRIFMLCICFIVFCLRYVQKRLLAKFIFLKDGK